MMAGVGEEEVDYESDPEEAKLSLTMRRREASDDEEEEEGEEEGERREKPTRRIDSRVEIGSDYESDGQGAAAEYDDDDDNELEEEEEEEEDEYEESGGEVKPVAAKGGKELEGRSVEEATEVQGMNEEKKENETFEVERDGGFYVQEDGYNENAGGREQEEKKDNEPFAVPTAGAFYMHDDRFRDSAGGRHRRTLGGRKLWESKDDKKWGHDKFEEMSKQERHYEEGRRVPRGRYRARGKNRGEDHEYQRGNRPKAYNNNNNQNIATRAVRGRGSRRYQSSTKNNSEAPTQNKQPGKLVEKASYASSGRVSIPTANGESDTVPTRKQFESSLSSASPPFYPSGSSNKEINLTQKRDLQAAPSNRHLRSSVTDESFSTPHSNAMRGKNIANSIGMDKLYIDDSISQHASKPLTNLQMPPSGSSLMNSTQTPQSRAQGRVATPLGQMAYQATAPHNQVNRSSPPTQLHGIQRAPVQSRTQLSLQASRQQLGQRPGSGSQASSPPKAARSINSFESGDTESLPESSKSKIALIGKGKSSVQGNGRGSFPYGGAQVVGASGNMGGGPGDQNFPPTFLPVMPFGRQHPGGIGVPAVGMAFPGYVAQPQLGLGNSEMTWLPVLAGAAGALGATYCSPYLAVDGAYHARPSGQTSALAAATSKESNANKPGNELKPSHRPELANDEFGQRQNKARRYTEMKFDQ